MPIPKPRKGEDKNAFMGRCMGVLKDEKKPQDQKVAICFSQWKRGEADASFLEEVPTETQEAAWQPKKKKNRRKMKK